MSQEKPPKDDKKKVIEFPSSRRKPASPSESQKDSSPSAFQNVYDIKEEEKKRLERKTLDELREKLDPHSNTPFTITVDQQSLRAGLIHEMMYSGLSEDTAQQAFDSAMIGILMTESDPDGAFDAFPKMSEEEQGKFYEERWKIFRQKYQNEYPHAREIWFGSSTPKSLSDFSPEKIQQQTLDVRFFIWFYNTFFMRPAKFFSKFFSKPTPPSSS